jgi:hypothetical protein
VKSVQASIECGEPCNWSFFNQAREVIIFVPKCTTQKEELSGGPSPLVPQWSLVSVPRPSTYEAIKLQVMQAPTCRLYAEIYKQDVVYQLVHLSLCSRCINGFFLSPDFTQENKWLSLELSHSPHCGSEGSITVTLLSEIGAWMNNHFEIFAVTGSGGEVEEMPVNRRVSILISIVSEKDKVGLVHQHYI